jgi:hypothetical protein
MATGTSVTLPANTATLIYTAGSGGASVTIRNDGANGVNLGGPNVNAGGYNLAANSSGQNNPVSVITFTLGPNDSVYGYSNNVDGMVGLLASELAGQSVGVQHVIVDSGTVTADQGAPNTNANEWPVRANKV